MGYVLTSLKPHPLYVKVRVAITNVKHVGNPPLLIEYVLE
jgi:hypothetical protein